MDDSGQGPIRWLILAALLLGGAVWYSWTFHRPTDHAQTLPPRPERTSVVNAAVEVEQAQPEPAPPAPD